MWRKGCLHEVLDDWACVDWRLFLIICFNLALLSKMLSSRLLISNRFQMRYSCFAGLFASTCVARCEWMNLLRKISVEQFSSFDF